MKKQSTSGRAGIIGAVINPLRFFTLVCLVIEATLGGLAFRLSGTAQIIALWGMIGTLVLLIIVVALIATFRPQSLGPAPEQPSAPDLDALSGAWWELIPNDPNIAVSFIEITAAANLQVHLEGTAYDRTGVGIATWRSEWACFNHDTRELFYFWIGDELSRDTLDDDFSGVGYLYFGPPANTRRLERGTGWFTVGNLRELRLDGKRKIDVRRVSEPERKQIADDAGRAAVALSVYEQWAKALPKEKAP